MNVYDTFWVKALAYKWDGTNLNPLQNFDGTILVDSQRNKVMIHANITVVPTGVIYADILLDFTEGFAMISIPQLETCQYEELNFTMNISEELNKLYTDRTVTSYEGGFVVPWDVHSS